MSHSAEPWGCHDKGTEFPTICKEREDGSCHEIAELTGCQGMTHEERVANGERIVACVNACQGISTEALVRVANGSARIAVDQNGEHTVIAWPNPFAPEIVHKEEPSVGPLGDYAKSLPPQPWPSEIILPPETP